MKSLFITLLAIVLISSFILAGCAEPELEKPITLVFTTHEAPGGTYVKGFFEPWIAELDERTEGMVKVEAHYGAELVAMEDAYDAAVAGTVDIAQFLTMMVPEKFPMEDVVAFTSYDKLNYKHSRTVWELYEKFPEWQAEYEDVKVLFLGATYFTSLATTEKCGPVLTLEDCQGFKSAGVGKWPGRRGEALGWTVAALPPEEVYTSLETGVIDGGPLGTLYILYDFGWGDVLPYVTRVRTNAAAIAMVMNLDTYNSLPDDIQDVFDDMCEWLVDLHDQWSIEIDEELYESLQLEFGTQFFELTEEEAAKWMAADEPVKEEFIADMEARGLPGQELMDEYLELEEKYSTR